MRRTAFLIAGIFLLSISVCALEISGRVVTSEGKPVADAVVLHRPSGEKGLSGADGHFALQIPKASRARLEVIHPDYLEEEVLLTEKEMAKPVTIILTPLIRQREEIVVTAMRYPEPSVNVPAAGTVISAETLARTMAPNIAESLAGLPGVSNLGSGGFTVVPSIRGLARNRVLLMIDNARLTSYRRTGPSASFINPEDIERIEILRSPSSVFYGSDAVGGVVNIFTKSPNQGEGFRGRINAKYGSLNREKSLGLALEGSKRSIGFYLSGQTADAENYSSPLAEVLQSQFSQSSLMGKVFHRTEKREVELSFLGARGVNIGKPSRDSATRPTWYPRENQNLVRLRWHERQIGGDGDLTVQFYFNPNFQETRSERLGAFKSRESFARTENTDLGFQATFGKKFGSFRVTSGADYFGQTGAQAVNKDWYFDAKGNIIRTFEETPFNKGRRSDIGLFASCDYSGLRNIDLVGGLRWDFLHQEACPGGGAASQKDDQNALTGFLAGSMNLAEKLVVFANLSRAYRVPNLSERFYTGTTGRGFIISKPDLKSETSLNLDAGIKFVDKRVFAAVYAFYYEIDNLVERYLVLANTFTFGNVDKGRIKGVEAEIEYFPVSGLSFFGNFTALQGKSLQTQAVLNDIPPARLYLGSRAWMGRLTFEINGSFQNGKDNPGPAEISIPRADIVNAKAGYFIGPLHVYCVLSNLFNKNYLARPDPDAMEEPGRKLLIGLAYSF